MYVRKYNKKGQEGGPSWGLIGLILAALFFLIYIIFGKGLFVISNNNIGVLSNCGSLTSGLGFCKPDCKEGETKYPNFGGCPPADDPSAVNCCLNPDKSVSSALPTEFGGSDNYNFHIDYIGVVNALAGCTVVPNTYDLKWSCPKNTALKIQFQELIINDGIKTVEVYALPLVTMNDDINTMTTPATGNTLTLQKTKDSGKSIAEISIIASKATGFYRIYGYAKCYTQYCKDTNPKGVLRPFNENTYIEVTFT